MHSTSSHSSTLAVLPGSASKATSSSSRMPMSDEQLSKWGSRLSVLHFLICLACPLPIVALNGAVALFGLYGSYSYKREALLLYMIGSPTTLVSAIVQFFLTSKLLTLGWLIYFILFSTFQMASVMVSISLRKRLPEENRILELQDESWL